MFIPLGGCPRTQHLSRLTAAHEPSIHPAWRPSTNPAFIPLGSRPQPQHSSRLAAPRTQHSSRLVVASSSVSSFCSVCMPPAFFFCKRDIRRIFRFYCPHRHEVGPCRRQYVADNACARATTASWPSIRHRRFFLPLTPCSFSLRVPHMGNSQDPGSLARLRVRSGPVPSRMLSTVLWACILFNVACWPVLSLLRLLCWSGSWACSLALGLSGVWVPLYRGQEEKMCTGRVFHA